MAVFLPKTYVEPMRLKNTWMRIPASELARLPALVTADRGYHHTARLFNLRVIRRVLIPAAGLHSTARDLAAFFQMLLDGGE